MNEISKPITIPIDTNDIKSLYYESLYYEYLYTMNRFTNHYNSKQCYSTLYNMNFVVTLILSNENQSKQNKIKYFYAKCLPNGETNCF